MKMHTHNRNTHSHLTLLFYTSQAVQYEKKHLKIKRVNCENVSFYSIFAYFFFQRIFTRNAILMCALSFAK